MAELHVRNLPPGLHERLRNRAAAEGRSMSAEVIAILRAALQPLHAETRQRNAIDHLREIQNRTHLPRDAQSAEGLVREDRESAG